MAELLSEIAGPRLLTASTWPHVRTLASLLFYVTGIAANTTLIDFLSHHYQILPLVPKPPRRGSYPGASSGLPPRPHRIAGGYGKSPRPDPLDPKKAAKGDLEAMVGCGLIGKRTMNMFLPLVGTKPLETFSLKERTSDGPKFVKKVNGLSAAIMARRRKIEDFRPTTVYTATPTTRLVVDNLWTSGDVSLGWLDLYQGTTRTIVQSSTIRQPPQGRTDGKIMVEQHQSHLSEGASIIDVEGREAVARINFASTCFQLVQKSIVDFLDFILNAEFVYGFTSSAEVLKERIRLKMKDLKARTHRAFNVVITEGKEKITVSIPPNPRIEVW